MRILIINNLFSGLRDGAIFTFIRHFSSAGDEVVVRNVGATEPIADLLPDAHDFDLVVAAGGDGTISSTCYALRGSLVPILPFPAGTGNLMVTNLGLPDEPFALAELARDPFILDFDLGEVTYQAEGGLETRGFAVAAGVGFDADIIKAASGLKAGFGPGAYVLAALSHANPTYSSFELELDGEKVLSEGIAVLLLNFAQIGPRLSITHGNDARDGLLEVTVLRQHNAVELLPALLAAFLDRDGGFPSRSGAVETYLSSQVQIVADPPLPLQYDGESPGLTTPLSARSLKGATRLVVPRQTYDKYTGA